MRWFVIAMLLLLPGCIVRGDFAIVKIGRPSPEDMTILEISNVEEDIGTEDEPRDDSDRVTIDGPELWVD